MHWCICACIDTEIDYSTYLQHAKQYFVQGETHYARISGDSGPIAYPAGYLYAYELIRRVCGDCRRRAQRLFAALYLLQLALIFAIYQATQTPCLAYLLALGSRRLRSIYVLRMFNDGVAMPLMFASIWALTRRRWGWSCGLFGAALSVKMNVLLFYPAFLLIHLVETGFGRTLKGQLLVAAWQIVPALPFVLTDARAYLRMAYNVGRRFEWKWTVNWRFLGMERFLALQRSSTLLILHAILLGLWTIYRFHRPLLRIRKDAPPAPVLSETQMVRFLFECNLIGILCARSLHYQFLAWYSLSIPFLLLNGQPGPRLRRGRLLGLLAVYFAIEYCWNVFPSTALSSLLLLCMNCVLLLTSLAVV